MAEGTYIARGNQRYKILKTQTFDVDNGSGTTVDDVLFANLPYDIYLKSVQAVYAVGTDTAGAEDATFKVGITAGGATIVAATNIEDSKAVGSYTAGSILIHKISKGSSLFVRHTGVASTQPGSYYVEVIYRVL